MLFLGRDTVYASPSPVVALVDVLENSGSLGLVNFRGVNRRQSLCLLYTSLCGQPSGFFQDVIRNSDLTDVMKDSCLIPCLLYTSRCV